MKRPRILVIEDEHEVRVSLRNALEGLGCVVWTATSGSHALRLLGTLKRPRVIILDLLMPLMDGLEFLKHKEKEPKLKDIPVIAISAAPDVAGLLRGASVDGFIQKPFELDTLIDKLEPYLQNCSAEELADETEADLSRLG